MHKLMYTDVYCIHVYTCIKRMCVQVSLCIDDASMYICVGQQLSFKAWKWQSQQSMCDQQQGYLGYQQYMGIPHPGCFSPGV